MTSQKAVSKQGRPSRSLQEEIAAAEARLQQLRTKQREEEKRELEKNQKAIWVVIKSAGLDAVPSEKWAQSVTMIAELLQVEKKAKSETTTRGTGPSAKPKGSEDEIAVIESIS